jgi:hypothetical protein
MFTRVSRATLAQLAREGASWLARGATLTIPQPNRAFSRRSMHRGSAINERSA